jgi:methionyl-tRNA formyltransferase
VSNKKWYFHLPDQLNKKVGKRFLLIKRKEDLNVEYLSSLQPRYIFFPHWSYIVPPEVHEKYECVIFHMTDLPFGRGGSPLQNLIARGIYETKISAIKCVDELDAGPVYMKVPFYLYGNAEEIYMRAADTICNMIECIINTNPIPIPQTGEIVYFKRRKPSEGNLIHITDIRKAFDYIRMLDADGYPKAFIETEFLRFEFERAVLRSDHVHADVKILRKSDRNE